MHVTVDELVSKAKAKEELISMAPQNDQIVKQVK